MISVDPGAVDANQKVQDVFIHVLDLFDLLAKSSDENAEGSIAWRLVRVSMNSPLTVVAEAIAVRPDPVVKVDAIARRQKEHFARNLVELKGGRVPRAWGDASNLRRIARAFSHERPGTLRVQLEDEPTAASVVEVAVADILKVEEAVRLAPANEPSRRARTMVGSIDGYLVEVGTFYNQPAIKLRERKTRGEVWCTVTEQHRQEVASSTNFDDVWAGRRVLVEGKLFYSADGSLSRIVADHIQLVPGRAIDHARLYEPDFTDGMATGDYLERFREGTLG